MKRVDITDTVVDLPHVYDTTRTHPRTLAESEQRARLWRMTWGRTQRQRPMAWYVDEGPPPPGWLAPAVAAVAIVAALVVFFGEPGWAVGGWL